MENRHYVNNALHNDEQIDRMCEHWLWLDCGLCYVSNSCGDEIY